MLTGLVELLICASMDDMGVDEDQPVMLPEDVLNESGTPVITAAWRCVSSLPA